MEAVLLLMSCSVKLRKVQGGTRISISTQVDIRTNKCRF
uniref:Uncharacterized protein n=1 Tax=Picea sitchensis TaxID=3332 RepID=A9NSJ1_PICSI|nr:unknown [Picea sitchensis]